MGIIRSLCCAILLILFCPMQAQTITLAHEKDCETIQELLPEPILLSSLTHSADVAFSKEEFLYLVDLPVGSKISSADLCEAIPRLFQKKLFETITITVEDDGAGKGIHFNFVGLWIFQKFKVSGIWVNKDRYKQYYLMDPGDVFNEDKHEHAMRKIKEVCARDGFFNAKITSEFVRDVSTKSVVAHATIKRSDRFVMRDLSLVVRAEGVPADEIKEIEEHLDKKYIRPMRGTKYAKSFIERQARSIRQYLIHCGFLQSSIKLSERLYRADGAVRLVWKIDLNKRRIFIFFGNRAFSHYQLLDRILQFGRSAWIVPASILADELKVAYRARGFLDILIEARDEGNRSFFVIKEGRQATIDSVEIRNAHQFTSRLLQKRCFPSLKKRLLFDHGQLHEALDALTDFYLCEGFLDMKIVAHELVPLEGAHYTLLVIIEEGDRTMVHDLVIPDYPELEKQPLFLGIKRSKLPKPYGVAMMQEQKRWLMAHFEKQGYLFASAQSELQTVDDKTIITWHIDPGKQVCFGKTVVQGSSAFPFPYVLRELRYKEGQCWDQEKIRQSFLRLRNLQLFDIVSLTPISLSDSATRPVLVKLCRDDPFEIRVRAGFELQHIRQYQTFTGLAYKVGGTFIVKDPFGCGDQLRLDVDIARSHRELVFKYQYPWLLSLPIHSTFQIYDTKYEQPGFVGSKNDIYTVFQTGGLIGLRHQMRSLDVGGTIGFEFAETTLKDNASVLADQLARAINFDAALLGKRVPFLFVEPSMMIDRLDNNLNPTRGSFSLFNIKGMFPAKSKYSHSFFIKFLVEHSLFFPVRSVVVALRLRFGHIFHRQFCEIMPTERFYLGGSHSIRSYATDLAPPLGCFIDEKGKRCVVPRGGKTMVNVNAELRIPLFKNAGFVLFQDVGALSSDQFADFKLKHVAAGTGFGARYLTPIGPLRFDVAWKWKKQAPNEHSYNWFLTFGHAF
ncbi:hypothetical protein E3J61_01225 [Candidatus Dependentiae bacterium]|nr:MAG: hypothetical protein E3J61_01225 [Candidatus Dependentiae bacterium]